MYEKILTTIFSDFRKVFPEAGVNYTTKICTLHNCDRAGIVQVESDIIVFYDCLEDSTPLLVIERIDDEALEDLGDIDGLEALIKDIEKELDGYVIAYNIVENKEYVDVTIVKNNVYNVLKDD